jgi:hypothetical protein
MRSLKTSAVAIAATFALIGGSAALAAPSEGFYSDVPSNLSRLKPGTLIKSESESTFLPTLSHHSAAYRIMYRSTGHLGSAVAVSGMVFVPQGRAPRGGWPIVAWDHGTSGVGDQCNPSRWPDLYDGGRWDLYLDQVDNLLAEGYVVTATDYEGLGTPGLHTYLQTNGLGRAVIDGVRAARQLVPNTSSRWATIGHSEGGQASIGAGELAATYGKGLTLVGSAAYAPAQHLELAVEVIASDKFSAPYLAYMAVGMRSIDPEFGYARFVGPLYADRMTDAEEHCFDEWFFIDNYGVNPSVETALNPNWATDPTVQRWFDNATVGQRPGAAPILVLQGTGDGLFATYDLFLDEICATGTAVHGITYNRISHDHVLVHGWADARDWLRERFAGRPAPNDC